MTPSDEQTAVWNIVMFLECSALLKHNLEVPLLTVISHIVNVMHVLPTVLHPLVVGFESVTKEESWTSSGVKTGETRVKCCHLSVYCLRSPQVGIPKSKSLMAERTRQILYALRRYPHLAFIWGGAETESPDRYAVRLMYIDQTVDSALLI
jgi:hypothetical protein